MTTPETTPATSAPTSALTTKAVLFDWDGTLADTMGALFAANVAVMAAFGLPFDETRYRRHFSPDWRIMYTRLGIPEERLEEANRLWLDAYGSGSRAVLLGGAADALDRLSTAGYRLGLVTAGHRDIVGPQLDRLAVRDFFEVVVFGTDMAEQKPDPAPLRAALAALDGVRAEEAVYVGDTVEDVTMATAAGVRAVGVPSIVHPPEALAGAGASAVAPSVAAWVDGLLGAPAG